MAKKEVEEVEIEKPDVINFGEPGLWETLTSVSSVRGGWRHSTSRMKLPNGYLYNVYSETPAGTSQALAFVPA